MEEVEGEEKERREACVMTWRSSSRVAFKKWRAEDDNFALLASLRMVVQGPSCRYVGSVVERVQDVERRGC